MNNNQKKIDELLELVEFFRTHPDLPPALDSAISISTFLEPNSGFSKYNAIRLCQNNEWSVFHQHDIISKTLPLGSKVSWWFLDETREPYDTNVEESI